MTIIVQTERLVLRTWKARDAKTYYDINQDPKVIEFLLGSMTMEQVEHFIKTFNEHQVKYGYTLWAAELEDSKQLIGFIGLGVVPYDTNFTPAVEVGWRLGSKFWGKGYATEGAKAALEYGFNKIGLKEIVSFTTLANERSIRVMEKIGMTRDFQGDFNHPKLDLNHPLSKHILYRIKRLNSIKLNANYG